MGRNHNTSCRDDWQTPDEITDMLTIADTIDLDPCAGPSTDIAETNWTEDDDGLSKTWFGRVFVNPPFTNKGAFLEKAVEQIDNTSVIFVVTPDSTDTISWWHKYIAPNAQFIWFSKGRIQYVDPSSGEQTASVTFGTAISIFGEPSDDVLHELNEHGQLVRTVRFDEE